MSFDSTIDFQRPLVLADHVEIGWDAHGALVITDLETVDVPGRLAARLVPLLDGTISAQEIVRFLKPEGFSTSTVLEAIGSMWRAGYVTCSPAAPSSAAALFWADLPGVSAGLEGSVSVRGRSAASELIESLCAAGVVIGEPVGANLDIVVLEDYLDLVDGAVIDQRRPWLPVKLVGRVGWLGPIFDGNQTACWRCLEHRLLLHREVHRLVATKQGRRVPRGDFATGRQVVAGLCATQVTRWLRSPHDPDHPLWAALVTFDTVLMRLERHVVTRRPQCPRCGTARLPESSPVRLRPSSGVTRGADGHRLCTPEQLFQRWGHHVSSVTGIVSSERAVAAETAHVHRAMHVRPRAAESWDQALNHRRMVAAGKGLTATAARAGALAEALERYSAMWDGTEPHLVASFEELGHEAVHPNACMLFSDAQMAAAEDDPANSPKRRVPRPLDENRPLTWVRAWSLTHRWWRYVAAASTYVGFPLAEDNLFCVADSNGNAAGSCREEAILQGTLELVERDGVALWWYNRLSRPGVAVEGADTDYVHRLRRHYRDQGREFWVLDLTSDLGIPTFAAISRRVDDIPASPVMGFGAHLDAAVAILRALTEMNQMLPHALAQAQREDRRIDSVDDRPDSLGVRTLDDHPYMLPDATRETRSVSDFRAPDDLDLCEEVDRCRRIFEKRGLEMLVVDLTRPDVGMPVVRVIAPGLRHFWRRLAPGRLYEVPVEEGWLPTATVESEVNPLDLAI